MSYNLNQEYTVRRVNDETPCSLRPGAHFTIKEVIPEKIIPEKIIPKMYKIETDLGTCAMSLTGEDIAKFVSRAGGGGNRRSKRRRCRSKRKKRSKKRSKK